MPKIGRKRRPSSPNDSESAYLSTFETVLLLVVGLGLLAASCQPDLEIPEPPDPPPAVYDEIESGSCPASLDWIMTEYDPYADAVCRALYGPEECGSFDALPD